MYALKCKSPEQRLIVEFRHDVFKYLFFGKGKACSDKNWKMYEEIEFSKCGFPANWNIIVDQHGDGIKLSFPVKMRTFLAISPKTYHKVGCEMKEVPRTYIEKLSVKFIKISASFGETS